MTEDGQKIFNDGAGNRWIEEPGTNRRVAVDGAGNKVRGRVTVLFHTNPNTNELKAADILSGAGFDVTFVRTASSEGIKNVRTGDVDIVGIGRADIYTPLPTSGPTAISRAIEKKNTQAPTIIIQATLSQETRTEISNRVWGKPEAQAIKEIIFVAPSGEIIRIPRPPRG